MPKQYYTIRSFAKGMNTRRDPRDIAEDEAGYIRNMSIDALGKIKSAGSMYSHETHQSGSGTVGDSKYVSERGGASAAAARISGSGGYNLFYFESDHSSSVENTITEDGASGGSSVLAVGSSDKNISFENPSTLADSGLGDPGTGDESPR